MKYLIILGDGMADYPVAALQNRTPLEAADKPHMDALAAHGTMGLVRTVPQGMPPGSDTANMSVMGFPPRVYYSGRSPLEAVSLGIDVHPEDVTFRTNLVCLSEDLLEMFSQFDHQIIIYSCNCLDKHFHIHTGQTDITCTCSHCFLECFCMHNIR